MALILSLVSASNLVRSNTLLTANADLAMMTFIIKRYARSNGNVYTPESPTFFSRVESGVASLRIITTPEELLKAITISG